MPTFSADWSKRVARVWLLALLLPLCGCPYVSSVPLEEDPNHPIDPQLLGNWREAEDPEDTQDTDEPEESLDFLTIYQWDAHTYALVFADTKQNTEARERTASVGGLWRIHPVQLKGRTLLQIQEPQEDASADEPGAPWGFVGAYTFCMYEFADNGDLLVRTVEEDFYKGHTAAGDAVNKPLDPPTTTAELRTRMIEHWDDSGMFADAVLRLRRESPDDWQG